MLEQTCIPGIGLIHVLGPKWLTKVGIIIGIVVMFLLLFCCIVPFIRSMLASAAAKQMINVSVRPTGIDVGCTNMYTVGPGLDELDEFV